MLIIKSTHPRLPKQKMQLIPFYIPSQLFHPYRCGCNTIPNTSSTCSSWKQLSHLSSETQKMQLVTFYISPWSTAQLPCQTKLFFAPHFFPLNPPPHPPPQLLTFSITVTVHPSHHFFHTHHLHMPHNKVCVLRPRGNANIMQFRNEPRAVTVAFTWCRRRRRLPGEARGCGTGVASVGWQSRLPGGYRPAPPDHQQRRLLSLPLQQLVSK